jgi:hypothetical protein
VGDFVGSLAHFQNHSMPPGKQSANAKNPLCASGLEGIQRYRNIPAKIAF